MITDFVDDMAAAAYRWAHFVIGRAGAGTIAEMGLAALPALSRHFGRCGSGRSVSPTRTPCGVGAVLGARRRVAVGAGRGDVATLLASPETLVGRDVGGGTRDGASGAAAAIVADCERLMEGRRRSDALVFVAGSGDRRDPHAVHHAHGGSRGPPRSPRRAEGACDGRASSRGRGGGAWACRGARHVHRGRCPARRQPWSAPCRPAADHLRRPARVRGRSVGRHRPAHRDLQALGGTGRKCHRRRRRHRDLARDPAWQSRTTWAGWVRW